jgi:predicted nucleotidyltransferase
MKHDINSDSDILRIRQILKGYPHVRLALLFGSLAKGNARKDSDLDLAIATDHPLDSRQKMQLIAELASAIGRPIDLVDFAMIGEPLLGQIIVHGRRILGDDDHYARLLSTHLFAEADFVPYQTRILQERRQAWIGH